MLMSNSVLPQATTIRAQQGGHFALSESGKFVHALLIPFEFRFSIFNLLTHSADNTHDQQPSFPPRSVKRKVNSLDFSHRFPAEMYLEG